ncbi:HAD-IIIA family hydrolase [Nocardia blacklockiae]|uniref:HAD-IIIA family hydrolase n=1 Tax=Nocardia blacklockiae TaxID=480036 RepID=UPI0018941C5A|nr:HAD-IIIA family hydrolase [Nocardia blacklockiae]MBF6175329.1 HAD-IIIA family hydrolase [Nocardia blacklockiae]
MHEDTPDYTIVIPTIGRAGLTSVLRAVDGSTGLTPAEIVVVDDRPAPQADREPLSVPDTDIPVRVVRSGGRGPAAARNVGWRSARTEWIAFLDDDVIPGDDWRARLAEDLRGLPRQVAGSQARIRVPLPPGRRPTDAERGTAALATARWITADMAYRRAALAEVGGFDERFRRAYREDSDLAARIVAAGHHIVTGSRVTTHPPATGSLLYSLRMQAGNADNALMRHKYGRDWRRRIGEGGGRLGRHAAITAAGGAAVACVLGRRPGLAAVCLGLWLTGTVEFAARRIGAGPATASELTAMSLTSVLIPPAACWHRMRGEWQVRRRTRRPRPVAAPPLALLFDRDDTLIVDVPYLSDPALVQPVPRSRQVLDRLRAAGVRLGVVSNQSGVARALITPEQLRDVSERVEELLGPFDTWQVCPHQASDECACRKPKPGLVTAAARALGVPPQRCVVVGDIGADVDAALAAGARAVLVPTAKTRPDEITRAEAHALVAPDLESAVELAMAGAR